MNNEFKTITKKIIDKNLVSHAYLISTDETYDRKYIIDFIKDIIASYDIGAEEKEKIYNLIDANSFSDLKIIEKEGIVIKKNQIIDLQEEYKTKSFYNGKRFYIIEFAEDLNNYSFNTLLKFLEEPENDVTAFLITKNIDVIAPTIISRCQIINLHSNIENSYSEEEIEKAKKYLSIILSKKQQAIPYLYELYNEETKTIKVIINIWIELISSYIIDNKTDFDFSGYTKKELIRFVEIFDVNNKYFDRNFNTGLILDDIIIKMFGDE